VRAGDLVKFKFPDYHESYGLGFVYKILHSGVAWALFNEECLVIRAEEVEVISASR